MQEFYLNSEYVFKIGEDDENLKRLGAGLSSVDTEGNEEVDQTPYLDGEGFATSDVTGGQPTFSFEGHRLFSDDAQNFVFEKQYTYGMSRRCYFKVESPNGDEVAGEATIANIEGPGGDANAKGEVSFEVHFAGKPTFTPATETTE